MRKLTRSTIIITTGLLLALLGTAFTQSIFVQSSRLSNSTGAALFFQATETPQPKGVSEIGSTDGIIVMGVVIVLIVVVPILLRRKSWRQN